MLAVVAFEEQVAVFDAYVADRATVLFAGGVFDLTILQIIEPADATLFYSTAVLAVRTSARTANAASATHSSSPR